MTGDPGAQMFDQNLEAWRAWQAAPWGRLRYRVVQETLARTCAMVRTGPLRVLDVGGGDGGDAIPLAQQGHDVTVLDFSAPLLAGVESAAEGLALHDRLRTVHCDLADLADLASAELGSFDVVLCHNVLQYCASTTSTVSTLAALLGDSGALSLLAPNPASDVLVAAMRKGKLPEALALLSASMVRTATFDRDVPRIEPDEAALALKAAGLQVVARFGIRCVTDFIADDARKHDPRFYADLEQLELALCAREPFLRTARMWQLIARRP